MSNLQDFTPTPKKEKSGHRMNNKANIINVFFILTSRINTYVHNLK